MNLLEQIEMCVFITAALFGAAQIGMIHALLKKWRERRKTRRLKKFT